MNLIKYLPPDKEAITIQEKHRQSKKFQWQETSSFSYTLDFITSVVISLAAIPKEPKRGTTQTGREKLHKELVKMFGKNKKLLRGVFSQIYFT